MVIVKFKGSMAARPPTSLPQADLLQEAVVAGVSVERGCGLPPIHAQATAFYLGDSAAVNLTFSFDARKMRSLSFSLSS